MKKSIPYILLILFLSPIIFEGCKPLRPNKDLIKKPNKQEIAIQFAGNTQNKTIRLKIFEYNEILGTESLEAEADTPIPDNQKISLSLIYGDKKIYGELLETDSKKVYARTTEKVTIIPGSSTISLQFDPSKAINELTVRMKLKTLGDLKAAKIFYDEDVDKSPKVVIEESCIDGCHTNSGSDSDVDPYLDSFPFVSKKTQYKDMAILVDRMLLDIQRHPKHPDVMPPEEGIQDKDDVKLFKSLKNKLSKVIDTHKMKIDRINFSWQVKNNDQKGELLLSREPEESEFKGVLKETLFKSDEIGGEITVLTESGTVLVDKMPLDFSELKTSIFEVSPQIQLDKTKIDIIIKIE